ncbi:MAG: Fe-S cluster assembly protein SufD [Alphaproteobacteria bacterium]|nr:Fe-S cluster assembly protein SufD [Alphaproteobacteria bacterium]
MISLTDIPLVSSERWKFTDLHKALKKKTLTPTVMGWGRGVVPLLTHAPGHERYGDTSLWDLNTAQTQDIKFISGSTDVNIHAVDGQMLTPRIIIHVKTGDTLTVNEFLGGTGSYWKNMVVQVHVEPGGHLYHHRIITESAEGIATIFTHVVLERDARYDAACVMMGAGMVRNQIHAEIKGSGAQCALNGVHLLAGEQHGDTTITIEHQAPHTQSHQTYKNVLTGSSRGVFQGKVHVHQAAQKTDGYQLSNTLMLSPYAEMDTKPELEIYADDVKCSHGATTGKLDENALFYLRARGIPLAQARSLLTMAFVSEVIDRIPAEDMRQSLLSDISQWLSDHV